MHKRKQIRDAFVAALVAADISEVKKSDNSYNIFSNRPTPAWEGELPAIFVYSGTRESGSETADSDGSAPIVYNRKLNIAVEIVCEAEGAVDDICDDICESVEQAIGDFQLKFPMRLVIDSENNVVEDVGIVHLTNTEIGLADDGRKIVGSCKLSFSVPYTAGLGEPLDTGYSPKIVHTEFADAEDNTVVLAETRQDLDPTAPDYMVPNFTWSDFPNWVPPVAFTNSSVPAGQSWSWQLKNQTTGIYDLVFSTDENPEDIDLLSYGAQYFTGGNVYVRLVVDGEYVVDKTIVVGN